MSAVSDDGTFAFRLKLVENAVAEYKEWRRDVDEDRTDLKYLIESSKKLEVKVEATNKRLVGLMFSIAGSSITLALTTLVATGKL